MAKSLLLVDDDEDDRDFFLEVVEAIYPDVVCVTARNGREALNKLTQDHYVPDLIFLDLNMPLMNGRQFLIEIQSHRDLMDIPVVILTTSSDEETKQETIKLGASHFITKPDKITAWEDKLKYVFNNIGKTS